MSGVGAATLIALWYVVFDGFNHGLFDMQLGSYLSTTMLALLAAAVLTGVRLWRHGIPSASSWTPLHVVLAAFVVYVGVSSWLGGGVL
jgi:hypothetical protein